MRPLRLSIGPSGCKAGDTSQLLISIAAAGVGTGKRSCGSISSLSHNGGTTEWTRQVIGVRIPISVNGAPSWRPHLSDPFCKESAEEWSAAGIEAQEIQGALWLNNQYKPMWADSRLGIQEDALVDSGMTGLQQGCCRQDEKIRNLCEDGQLDRALDVLLQTDKQGQIPPIIVYSSLLKACMERKALAQAKRLRAHMARHGLDSTRFLGEYVVATLVKCGSLEDALEVFHRLAFRTVFSWTAVISGYTIAGQGEQALGMYRWMKDQGVQPNTYTFVSLIKACGSIAELEAGRRVHSEVKGYRFESDIFVATCLIDMYAKCGSIPDAQIVFDGMSERNVVSWTVMLAAYAQQGQPDKVLQLYEQMQEEGVSPDDWTLLSALQACSMLGARDEDAGSMKALGMGKAIHAEAWRKGYASCVFLGNTLVAMYSKCGSLVDAQRAFHGLSHRTVVSWNVMLTAYIEHGQGDTALQLYIQMQEEGSIPDTITVVCILQACGATGSLDLCKQIHQAFISTGTELSPLLANTLIHAYGQCASMVDAQDVFDAMPQRDIVSWNTLLAGYARQGNWATSLLYYQKMQLSGTKPNAVTFLSLLSTCSHAGLVDQGVAYFQSMARNHGITPEIAHYVTMVDLLGRAGHLSMLQHLLSAMPLQPNLAMCLCVLAACRKHGNIELGKQAFDYAVQLQPSHYAAYLLMSSIYSNAGLWDKANEVSEVRHKAGAWKMRGQTWIRHDQQIMTFSVGVDSGHTQREELFDLVGDVSVQLRQHDIC